MLAHLAEIDARKLWAARAYDSMFAFCVGELGFSEGAAFLRITIARAARTFPAILEAVRSRRVHLAGLRLLLPHMDEANCLDLLAEASGKTKREIEELVARIARAVYQRDGARCTYVDERGRRCEATARGARSPRNGSTPRGEWGQPDLRECGTRPAGRECRACGTWPAAPSWRQARTRPGC